MQEPLEHECITIKPEELEQIVADTENDSILGIDSVYNPNFQDTPSASSPHLSVNLVPVHAIRLYVANTAPKTPTSSGSRRAPDETCLLRKIRPKPGSVAHVSQSEGEGEAGSNPTAQENESEPKRYTQARRLRLLYETRMELRKLQEAQESGTDVGSRILQLQEKQRRLTTGTPEYREAYLRRRAEAERKRRKRKMESPAVRENIRASQREAQRRRRLRLLQLRTPEQREKMLAIERECTRKRRRRLLEGGLHDKSSGLAEPRETEGDEDGEDEEEDIVAAARHAWTLLRKRLRKGLRPSGMAPAGSRHSRTRSGNVPDKGVKHVDLDNPESSTRLGWLAYPRALIKPNALPETPTLCNICNKQIPLRYLRLHLHQHKELGQTAPLQLSIQQSKCVHCGKVYQKQFLLQMHQRQVHQTPMLIKCALCDRCFKDKATLNKHKSKVHSGSGRS